MASKRSGGKARQRSVKAIKPGVRNEASQMKDLNAKGARNVRGGYIKINMSDSAVSSFNTGGSK